jgi:hypothetical protein
MKTLLTTVLSFTVFSVSAAVYNSDGTVQDGVGIAERYPGDNGIENDPAVILADGFESYTTVDQIRTRWGSASGVTHIRIATEDINVFSGNKSVEFTLPVSTSEANVAVYKNLNPTQDRVYFRMYQKFDPGYNVKGSNHNGIKLSAKSPNIPGQRPPADGTGWFVFLLENTIIGTHAGESPPGYQHFYVYWPRQRTQYGDHWFSDGTVIRGVRRLETRVNGWRTRCSTRTSG